MGGQADGRMDGWTDGRMKRRIDGPYNQQTDSRFRFAWQHQSLGESSQNLITTTATVTTPRGPDATESERGRDTKTASVEQQKQLFEQWLQNGDKNDARNYLLW